MRLLVARGGASMRGVSRHGPAPRPAVALTPVRCLSQEYFAAWRFALLVIVGQACVSFATGGNPTLIPPMPKVLPVAVQRRVTEGIPSHSKRGDVHLTLANLTGEASGEEMEALEGCHQPVPFYIDASQL